MYESFYGFRIKPFSILPDADFLYRSRGHRLALSLLEYGLGGQTGFTIITGEIGCGKTTVLQYALRHSDPRHTIGFITNSLELNHDLIKWVLYAFGIPSSAKDSVDAYSAFTEFVRARYNEGRDCVLIIDEAQLLNSVTLEAIRLLSNVNFGREHLLKIILVGQPELLETLSRPDLVQFSQRISASFHLEPLGLLETREYIHNRLRISGGEEDLFDVAACDAIYVVSKGVPRQINILCDTALVYGYADARPVIDLETMWTVLQDRAAAKNIDSMRVPPDFNRAWLDGMIRVAREKETHEQVPPESVSAVSEERGIAGPFEGELPSRAQSRSDLQDTRVAEPAERMPLATKTLQVIDIWPAAASERPSTDVSKEEASVFTPGLADRSDTRNETIVPRARIAGETQFSLFDLPNREPRNNWAGIPGSSGHAGRARISAKPFEIIPQESPPNGRPAAAPQLIVRQGDAAHPERSAGGLRRFFGRAGNILVSFVMSIGAWSVSTHQFASMHRMRNSNHLTSSSSSVLWAVAAVTSAALGIFYLQGLRFLFREWSSPEYSHGMLIPVISLGIAWLKRAEVAAAANSGSWAGPVLVALSLLLATAGQLATIYVIVHVSIVLTVIGLSLSFLGARATRVLWFPLLFLFFMIPLPDFLQVQLSARMQLLSSALGVSLIRLFGITVFLDGNVIDLGEFKMQVVEACSGLRYLFPLMSFGILVAYLYNGPFWQRVLLFLSTIPITILMNVARIGLIGILYDSYGIDAATGTLHDFQGWAIFIICLLLLLIEVWLLSYLLPRRRSIFDHFSLAARKT